MSYKLLHEKTNLPTDLIKMIIEYVGHKTYEEEKKCIIMELQISNKELIIKDTNSYKDFNRYLKQLSRVGKVLQIMNEPKKHLRK